MIRGAIFDLDGTIVDNMPLHAEALAIFANRHGLRPVTREDRKRLDGKRNRDIFPDLFGRPLDEGELDSYAGEKEALYRALSAGRLLPLTGLDRLLDRFDALDVQLAIATSAPPENVTHTLGELGLDRRFKVVARSDEVARGKPWPDVFLAAAAHLGVPAGDCLAFEDAPVGVIAALAAGMTTVAVATTFPGPVFTALSPPADLVVADFGEFLDGPGGELLRRPAG